MSLDGTVHAWQDFDEERNTTEYIVAYLDRETGTIITDSFGIAFPGFTIANDQPRLSGDGRDVYFVSNDAVTFSLFGAPTIIRFANDVTSGGIVYIGTTEATEAITDVSTSFDGERLLFRETINGVTSVVTLDRNIFNPGFGEWAELLVDTAAERPYLTSDGVSFTFAQNGRILKADINMEDPSATRPTPSFTLPGSFAPYWAKAPAPRPEPIITYEGSTVGGPTFQRPEDAGPTLLDGLVPYDAFSFTVEADGVYAILSEQDYDGYLHLYRAPFEPETPLNNLLNGNDDLSGNRNSGFRHRLENDTDYVLVTSAWAEGESGSFTNTITPD